MTAIRALACAVLAAFILLPLGQAVALSFSATIGSGGVLAGTIGLHSYAAIFRTPELPAAVVNSLTYVLLNVAFCLIAGLPAAYVLARFTVATKALFTFRTDWGLVMAKTVFSILPGVPMIFLVRNQIARGLVVRT